MSIVEKLKQIKDDFIKGQIPFEELLLYVEPLLMQVINGPNDDDKIKISLMELNELSTHK